MSAVAAPVPEPTRAPAISVVIPVHNEEEHVAPLYAEIRAVLDDNREPWELIFVNDGSSDETIARLRALRNADARVRVLDLDGNFGEAAALSAGFHAVRSGVIVTLDGDGQNDPADIPKLLDALARPGVQVVSGRRQERKEDALLRVWPSRLANYLIARVTGLPSHDTGCGLKAYRSSALPRMHLPRGMNRFLPAIFNVQPAAFVEVPTQDRPRQHGQSHYGISRTLVVVRDLLALPFIIGDPRRAEINFALATGGAAVMGAAVSTVSWTATALCDFVALVCGLIWWNVRRFNRAQSDGVYRIRSETRTNASGAGSVGQ